MIFEIKSGYLTTAFFTYLFVIQVVEEQLADEDNEDVYGLSRVADVLHALLSAYRESFFPHLDSLLPHLVQLLAPGRPYSDRQWAICIFDDVIEFGGEDC